MRNTRIIITAALVAISLVATPMTALAGKGKGKSAANPTTCVAAVTTLSAEEVAALQWMREEEKLARDIYVAMSTRYPENIFKNIADAEQKHFDAIGEKLVLFGLDDPAATTAPGEFKNPELQALYYDLLDAGWASYLGALQVGVTIEEEDVADLEAAIAGTTNWTLIQTYQNLLKASEQHLKSFLNLLE